MTRAEFRQRLKDRRMALGCSEALLAKRSQTARETIYRIEAGERVRRAVIDRVVAAIKDPGMPAACAQMKRRQLSGILPGSGTYSPRSNPLSAPSEGAGQRLRTNRTCVRSVRVAAA